LRPWNHRQSPGRSSLGRWAAAQQGNGADGPCWGVPGPCSVGGELGRRGVAPRPGRSSSPIRWTAATNDAASAVRNVDRRTQRLAPCPRRPLSSLLFGVLLSLLTRLQARRLTPTLASGHISPLGRCVAPTSSLDSAAASIRWSCSADFRSVQSPRAAGRRARDGRDHPRGYGPFERFRSRGRAPSWLPLGQARTRIPGFTPRRRRGLVNASSVPSATSVRRRSVSRRGRSCRAVAFASACRTPPLIGRRPTRR
jgi:hypothetical protein